MRKVLAVCLITLSLGGCAQLQQLQNLSDIATATVANPVTPDRLKQVESGALLVFKGLNLWKKSCSERLINETCNKQIEQVQVYTRQIQPYIFQLREFVKKDDQVNAVSVYNRVMGLIKTVKSQAIANGVGM